MATRSQHHTHPVLGASVLIALLLGLPFLGSCESKDIDPARPRFELRSSSAASLRYLLYLPAGYDLEKGKLWPMIVYLHGAGSTGDDPEAVKSGGLPARLAAGHAIPFIALSPQCPRGSTFSSEGMAARLAVLVEETGSAFRVDRARVSLTGFSMGGNGAWDLAAARPELFSRLAPVGSEGLARPADARRLAGLPVWIFQGSADGTFSVDLAERSRALLESVGVDARFTRWEGAGHLESAALSYADADLYEWLAGARKEETR